MRHQKIWNRNKKSIQVLAFADNINIIGRSLRVVKEAFLNLEKAAKEIGLTVNEDKTKFMEITEYPTNLCFLGVNGNKFEKVTQFKYLGTSITCDNDLSVEINNRIISANRVTMD
jgi:sorting nexin-29